MNVFKSMEGVFDIFCRSEDMAEFLNLQGKLEPLTLMETKLLHLSHHFVIEIIGIVGITTSFYLCLVSIRS